MYNMHAKIGIFVDRLLREAIASELTLDEAVTAFGFASRATAVVASESSDGSSEDCEAHARRRFEEAFAQPFQVIFGDTDMERLREAYRGMSDAAVSAILKNCNTHVLMRH